MRKVGPGVRDAPPQKPLGPLGENPMDCVTWLKLVTASGILVTVLVLLYALSAP